jgi:hypothetical protein
MKSRWWQWVARFRDWSAGGFLATRREEGARRGVQPSAGRATGSGMGMEQRQTGGVKPRGSLVAILSWALGTCLPY